MAKRTSDNKIEKIISNNLPSEQHYTRQPISLTFLKGDLSLSQVNALVEVVDSVQDKITAVLKKGKDEQGHYSNLFGLQDVGPDGRVNIDIKLSSLGVTPSHYGEVAEAVLKLQDIKFARETKIDGKDYWESVVLFPNISIPANACKGYDHLDKDGNLVSGKRYQGFIRFKFNLDDANALFSLNRYTQFLKTVTGRCRSQFTSRMYLYISSNKKFGKWNITYRELRRLFGATKFVKREGGRFVEKDIQQRYVDGTIDIEEEEKGGAWVRVKYPGYGQFKQKVLKVAETELKKMADEGVVDCYFTYDEILPNGIKRGTPDAFVFHIHVTSMNNQIVEEVEQIKTFNEIERKLIHLLDMKKSDARKVMELVDEGNQQAIEKKIDEIHHIIQTRKDIVNTGLYSYKAILSFIDDLTPIMESMEEPPVSYPVTAQNPKSSASEFSGVSLNDPRISTILAQHFGNKIFRMYLMQVTIHAYREGILTLLVPHQEVSDYISDNIIEQLKNILSTFVGRIDAVQFLVR